MKKKLLLISTLIIAGCQSKPTSYNVVQSENKTIKTKEVKNQKVIVTKITPEGYVVKHGDHYHFVKGSVPSNAIVQLEDIQNDTYVFNPADIVSETQDAYIVRHGDHYHYIAKSNPQHVVEDEAPYVFNPDDIISTTALGYIVKHGNHQHFVFKKNVPWYKPSIQVTKTTLSINPEVKDFDVYFTELNKYAKELNVSVEDIKVDGNSLFVKHLDHYHVYPSTLSN